MFFKVLATDSEKMEHKVAQVVQVGDVFLITVLYDATLKLIMRLKIVRIKITVKLMKVSDALKIRTAKVCGPKLPLHFGYNLME